LRSWLVSLILLVVLLAAGAAGLSAGHVHWSAWLIAASAAGAAAVAGIIKPAVDALVKARVDRITGDGASERQRGELLTQAAGSSQGFPLLRDIRSRAVLGVHPAIPLPTDANPSLSAELPTYVPRDHDADIRASLTRMSVTGGFLLLVGEPAAGKTRCAAEAIQALPVGWRIYVRSGTSTLQQIVDAGVSLERTVIWLDDIHQLLDSDTSDPAHLTAAFVRRLLLPGIGPVIIIGTTWPDRCDRYTRLPVDGAPDLMADARTVMGMAQQIDLDAGFTEEEWKRALSLSTTDPRLKEAVTVGSSRALAAALANRDELIRRWRSNRKPVVSAVISAAIDARRCGYPEPIPGSIIAELVPYYLAPSQRARVDSEWLESALSEACDPVRGDTRPMQPAGDRMASIDGYQVSDMLLEYAKNPRFVDIVSRPVWETLIKVAAESAVLYGIGVAAHYATQPEIATLAFQRAADAGNVSGINGLGFLLYQVGDHSRAEYYFRKAAEFGHPAALNNLGGLLAKNGEIEEAEAYYQRAIDAGHTSALTNMAFLFEGRGNIRGAETYYRRAAEAGSADALNNLGTLLASRGDSEEAEIYYRRAAEAGSADALNNLGTLLAGRDNLQKAERYYRRAVDQGNVDALNNLGVLLADRGDVEEAEGFYRRAIDAGSIDAFNGLGNLLAGRGDAEEAELNYRRAADAGNADALNNLGVLFAGRSDFMAAEQYYRRAADAGSPDALNNLGAILTDRGDLAGAENYYYHAINAGSSDALCGMGALLAGLNDSEDALRYYRRSTDPKYVNILDSLAVLISQRSDIQAKYRTRERSTLRNSATDKRRGDEHVNAWFQAAAAAGSARAMTIIAAQAARAGLQDSAIDWYRRAASQGDRRAMLRLSRILGPREGFVWMVRAVKGLGS
jgi:TPR repeat protein